MSDKVYKLIELVGTSPQSSDAAIQNAIARAGQTIRNLDWFEIIESRGTIKNGKVDAYQVKIRVGFRLE